MANPHKGEVTLTVGNVVYTLTFNANVLCSIEQQLGKGIVGIYKELFDMEGMSITAARAALYCALKKQHPKITLDQAGDMIIDAGGMAKVLPLIGEGMRLAFPDPDKPEDETQTENPITPGQSFTIGSGSSNSGSHSDLTKQHIGN